MPAIGSQATLLSRLANVNQAINVSVSAKLDYKAAKLLGKRDKLVKPRSGLSVVSKAYQNLSKDYRRYDTLYNFRCKPQAKHSASLVAPRIRFSGVGFWDLFSGLTPLADLAFFEHSHAACKGEAESFPFRSFSPLRMPPRA